METAQIFRNHDEIATSEVIRIFKNTLEQGESFQQEEIEELAEIYAKNPTDKFIIYDLPDVEGAQGDILIWAKGTTMYNQEIGNLKDLKETNRLVLQEGDSMTGDHRIIPLEGSNLTIKKGTFTPSFLADVGLDSFGSRNYSALLVTSDKPFLIFHREHGNICLSAGEYMFCSQLDSNTLNKMID